jgi:ABC-type Fe3+ transport system substrate-binding protein
MFPRLACHGGRQHNKDGVVLGREEAYDRATKTREAIAVGALTSFILRRLVPAALLVLVAFAAGPARAADESPELKALVAAAKTEGALSLVWGEGTLGGTNGAKLFESKMNAMFGTDIHVTFTPGASMPQVGNDIAMRQAAGQPSPTDVYIAFVDNISRLEPRKPFLSVDWQKLLPGRITDDVVELDGAAIKVVTALPGIAYNSKLAPSQPEKLTDLLKPEWKGKIASTPYGANLDILAANDMWGPERALDFVHKLSGQLAGLMRCNEGERLATGEFLAFAITCSGTDFIDTIRKGAPLTQIPPSDFPALGFFYLAVPKNAVHPNAAKLYTAFCMTPEGQALVRETWGTDLDLFPETGTHKIVADLEQQRGRKFVRVDLAWHHAHPEAYQTWKQIIKILTSAR